MGKEDQGTEANVYSIKEVWPILPRIMEHFDKKGAYYIGTTIAVIGSLLFHFTPISNLTLIMVLAAVSSVGFAMVGTLAWSMVPDTVEYGEYKTGVRTEGIICAVFSFSQKLATAVAGLLVATILETTDYVANAANQSPETLDGILRTLTIIPITLVLISAIAVHFYKIDRIFLRKYKRNLKWRTGNKRKIS